MSRLRMISVALHFNPRSPHGERLDYVRRETIELVEFQPTLPARGATRLACLDELLSNDISTHAPRTGSDLRLHRDPGCPLNFNPRSPHGERRGASATRRMSRNFNPRSPHGERLALEDVFHTSHRISTHAPRTGSDVKLRLGKSEKVRISTHAPRTGSDIGINVNTPKGVSISTHAPRTGSDCFHG